MDVEAAKRVCEGATPGPWESDGRMMPWLLGTATGVQVTVVTERFETGGYRSAPICNCLQAGAGKPMQDAAFISQARTLLPEAIEEIERLREEREGLLSLADLESCGAWQMLKADLANARAALAAVIAELAEVQESFGRLLGEHNVTAKSLADIKTECEELYAKNDTALADAKRLREALEQVQWGRDDGFCWLCLADKERVDGSKGSHNPTCPIGNALKGGGE